MCKFRVKSVETKKTHTVDAQWKEREIKRENHESLWNVIPTQRPRVKNEKIKEKKMERITK